jgi:hypothetical protein
MMKSLALVGVGSLIIGFGLAILIFGSPNKYERKLRDCARQHNVYACEMVAVPKTGEK